MYRLKLLKNGQYQIHSKTGVAYEGCRELVTLKALELGIKRDELEFAFFDLDLYGHNCAEFGIFGSMLYTRKMAC